MSVIRLVRFKVAPAAVVLAVSACAVERPHEEQMHPVPAKVQDDLSRPAEAAEAAQPLADVPRGKQVIVGTDGSLKVELAPYVEAASRIAPHGKATLRALAGSQAIYVEDDALSLVMVEQVDTGSELRFSIRVVDDYGRNLGRRSFDISQAWEIATLDEANARVGSSIDLWELYFSPTLVTDVKRIARSESKPVIRQATIRTRLSR